MHKSTPWEIFALVVNLGAAIPGSTQKEPVHVEGWQSFAPVVITHRPKNEAPSAIGKLYLGSFVIRIPDTRTYVNSVGTIILEIGGVQVRIGTSVIVLKAHLQR